MSEVDHGIPGIDCLDPLEPRAGMDIASVKRKYGNRIAIKGNVDCAKTLTFGTRVGENSKVILLGDLNQRDTRSTIENTGLYRNIGINLTG